jgi:hypothetical protein
MPPWARVAAITDRDSVSTIQAVISSHYQPLPPVVGQMPSLARVAAITDRDSVSTIQAVISSYY